MSMRPPGRGSSCATAGSRPSPRAPLPPTRPTPSCRMPFVRRSPDSPSSSSGGSKSPSKPTGCSYPVNCHTATTRRGGLPRLLRRQEDVVLDVAGLEVGVVDDDLGQRAPVVHAGEEADERQQGVPG